MQVISADWLTELIKWAMIPGVGLVGTKLLHPNLTIQHAGMVMGLQGFVGHVYLDAPDHYWGLTGSVDWTRNVSAVTGACQLLRRSVFLELSGYDEGFQLVGGDVDFCLRAIELGYRVVYAPSAALIHHQGATRGYQTPVKDLLRTYEKMKSWLARPDPYFPPNCTYTAIPRCQTRTASEEDRMACINSRRRSLERLSPAW